jgi:hypothetical protein
MRRTMRRAVAMMIKRRVRNRLLLTSVTIPRLSLRVPESISRRAHTPNCLIPK